MDQRASAPTAASLAAAIDAAGDPDDAVFLQRFFKTGPGQYGAGDVFAGVRVPQVRAIAKRFAELPMGEASALLDSPVHEHRLAALVIWVAQFTRTKDPAVHTRLHEGYLNAVHRGRVNNWDLVDASAEYLVGEHLWSAGADIRLLEALADSPDLWHRRVAMLATFAYIKHGDAAPALSLAERLLDDPEDLMHKAVGWMLREIGKRVSKRDLTDLLDAHAGRMPRTALSYATEHLSAAERARYRAMPRR